MPELAFLADTNVLVRLAEPDDPDHAMIRSAVETLAAQGQEPCYAPQNLVEFWNVCTRPVGQNGFGLSTEQADARARIIEGGFRLLPDNERIHSEWRRLVVRHAVAGAKVHDARLVAAMLVNNVQNILTLNDRDFARYSEVSAIHPRTLVPRGH